MARRKTAVFDFDGVINSYVTGFKTPTVILDPPVEGIREVIAKVREGMRVVVVSTRCASPGGIEAIEKYLKKHDIIVDKVQADKPPASVYVDDRAVCFTGKIEGLAEEILGFRNWIELEKVK